jgi:hypothetical protein
MQFSGPRIQDGRLELTGLEQLVQPTLNIHVPLPVPVVNLKRLARGNESAESSAR